MGGLKETKLFDVSCNLTAEEDTFHIQLTNTCQHFPFEWKTHAHCHCTGSIACPGVYHDWCSLSISIQIASILFTTTKALDNGIKQAFMYSNYSIGEDYLTSLFQYTRVCTTIFYYTVSPFLHNNCSISLGYKLNI